MSKKKWISLSDAVVIIIPTIVMIIGSYFYVRTLGNNYYHEGPIMEHIHDGIIIVEFGMVLFNIFQKEWKLYKGFLIGLSIIAIFIILNETEYLATIFGIDISEIVHRSKIKEIFKHFKLFIRGIHFFVSYIAFLIMVLGIIFWEKYEKIPVLNWIPKLSKVKYIYISILLLFTIVYSVKIIIIPVMHPEIDLQDVGNYYYFFEHLNYKEIIFLAEYVLGSILLAFKPSQL